MECVDSLLCTLYVGVFLNHWECDGCGMKLYEGRQNAYKILDRKPGRKGPLDRTTAKYILEKCGLVVWSEFRWLWMWWQSLSNRIISIKAAICRPDTAAS